MRPATYGRSINFKRPQNRDFDFPVSLIEGYWSESVYPDTFLSKLKLDQIALHDVTAVDDYVFHLTNVLLFQARVVGTVQEVDYKKRELWDTDTKILEDVFAKTSTLHVPVVCYSIERQLSVSHIVAATTGNLGLQMPKPRGGPGNDSVAVSRSAR